MKKQTGKVEMNTVIFKFIPTMEETYEFVDLTKDPTPTVSTLGHCERETPKKPSKERASLNLEMALLIMLLALSVVFGLQIVGGAINDTFLETAGALGIAGGSFEGTLPDSTNNGDGSYTIGWDGGTPPFDVIEDGVVIGDDIPLSPYTYTPMPGTHEVVIEDGDGVRTDPITLLVPLQPFSVFGISADGYSYALGVRVDGSVLAVGDDGYGQVSGVASWTNITQITSGGYHSVGLRSDGTVVACGYDGTGQVSGVSSWTGITQVCATSGTTFGLTNLGTVVACGSDTYGEITGTAGWTDIVAISTGSLHIIGLHSDGTVVAVGYNTYGQADVGSWTDIVQISTGNGTTLGLHSDGTVVACGYDASGQVSGVSSWTDIISISSGSASLGLHLDGTVSAVGSDLSGVITGVSTWGLP